MGRSLGSLLAAVAVALMILCCGPSHRLVHQGTIYFERCHTMAHRGHAKPKLRSCWGRWLQYYAEGQSLEKRRFAEERLIALGGGTGDANRYQCISSTEANSGSPRPCRALCERHRDDCVVGCSDKAACDHACEARRRTCMGLCH